MVTILVVAVGVALLGTTARATATIGPVVATSAVQTDAWISAEANYLSGRDTVVTCAASAEEWRQTLAAVGLPAESADHFYGFSLIQRGEIYLSPYVCEGLRLGRVASTRRGNELQVAWSVDVVIHESVHIGRSTADEALTEACARVGVPAELHRLYGLAYYSPQLTRLAAAATWFRRTQGPSYQGGSCVPPGAR